MRNSAEDLLAGPSGNGDTSTPSIPIESNNNNNNNSNTNSNNNTSGSGNGQELAKTSSSKQLAQPTFRRCPSPSASPHKAKNSSNDRREQSKSDTLLNVPYNLDSIDSLGDLKSSKITESAKSKSVSVDQKLVDIKPPPTNQQLKQQQQQQQQQNQQQQQQQLSDQSSDVERPKSVSKVSERAKKKAWYNVLYPSYKSRSEDFKKLFKDVPDDERLIVDYSCAIQRDILVHGRLYVSQNYLCFYANIFRWETCLCVKWRDVTSVTKEKTARVIPNAILVCTQNEKYFLTSFTTRDKAYLMLFRVWQNALMGKQMQPQEMWQWVHNCYGDELGLTSDDEDYIDPYEDKPEKIEVLHNIPKAQLSTKSAESFLDDKNVIENKSETDKIVTSSTDKSSGSSSSSSIQQNFGKSNNPDQNPNDSQQQQPTTSSGVVNATTTSSANNIKSKFVPREDSILSQCDQLPTDMSDSSDSEQNRTSFINQAVCTSMHEGRQLVHTILPITVDNLFSLIFRKSKFLVDFHTQRKSYDMNFGEWTTDDEGKKTRIVNITVTLTQPVGPKCAQVTETMELRECSKPGELYSIDVVAVNGGIPYADSFYVMQHYCMSRTVDDHTVFSVHAQVKYKKSVWGVVKGFIEKNTWSGLEDFYTALVRALQSEYCIPPAKSKARRPRRGISSQSKPIEVEPITKKTAIVPHTEIKKRPIIPVAVMKSKYESIAWFVITLLLGLVIVNVILYLKLSTLEEQTAEREKLLLLYSLKDPPKTHDEWIHILQKQEELHTTEMVKWQNVLRTAIDLLRKTERTLIDLQFLIKFNQESAKVLQAATSLHEENTKDNSSL